MLHKLFPVGEAISAVDAVARMVDNLFTSDEERLQAKAFLDKIRQYPGVVQMELNKIEAAHRSLFVAGWRPWIGWICGLNLLYMVVIRDWVSWFFTVFAPHLPPPPAYGLDITMELVIALLGLGGLRTYEKVRGKAK